MRSRFRIVTLALVLAPWASHAQVDRAGTWEFGASLLDFSSVSVEGPSGSSLEVDDDLGFGFTGAYHLTNRFAMGVDLSYAEPGYEAILTPDGPGLPQVIRTDLGLDVIQFKGIYHFRDDAITPFVELGAGWTYVDSNLVEGYGGSTCWWDPWWGYVCDTYFDTYSDTRTSYSYAFGFRWDLESSMVFRASWGYLDVDTNRAAEDIEIDAIQVSFGWRF